MNIFAQQDQVPNITNGWQFLFMALPSILSLATLIFGYLNSRNLAVNTAKTNEVHDIVQSKTDALEVKTDALHEIVQDVKDAQVQVAADLKAVTK